MYKLNNTTLTSIFASLDCSTIGACDLSSLGSFASVDDDKFNFFTISHTTQVLLWVVLDDGSLKVITHTEGKVNKSVICYIKGQTT